MNNAKAGIEFRTTDLSSIPVEIGLQGEDGFPHVGHMDYAAPQVDASTGTLEVRGLFDNQNAACSLVSSSGCARRSRSWTRQFSRPMWRLGRARRGAICWWWDRTTSSSAGIVKTGDREGPYRIIESGLDPGDWIVTEGVQRALPGAKVDPQQTKLSAQPPIGASR